MNPKKKHYRYTSEVHTLTHPSQVLNAIVGRQTRRAFQPRSSSQQEWPDHTHAHSSAVGTRGSAGEGKIWMPPCMHEESAGYLRTHQLSRSRQATASPAGPRGCRARTRPGPAVALTRAVSAAPAPAGSSRLSCHVHVLPRSRN